MIRVERKDGAVERRVLTGMIVEPTILGRISSRWNGTGLFQSKWSNLIAGWAVDYYRRYSRAPGKDIEVIFQSWAERTQDKNMIAIVERFLQELSGEYSRLRKELNPDHVVDSAGKLFNRTSMEQLASCIEGDLLTDKDEDALKRILSFRQVLLGVRAGVDLLHDKEATQAALESKREPIISFPGDLGRFFADCFERDSFISFLAKEKGGKSRMLMYIAYQALKQRRKVAYFQTGDMSQYQLLRRFAALITRRPVSEGRFTYPKSISSGSYTCKVTRASKDYPDRLDTATAWKAYEKLSKGDKECYLRLSCHPNHSLNIQGLESILLDWQYTESWSPDVVICDYADVMADPVGVVNDKRESINQTWSRLRSISQSLHCCVVTATQSDTDSYKKETLDMSNFSDSKTKNAHVTACIGINSNDEEREKELVRLNIVCGRDIPMSSSQCHCAGAWQISHPAVKTLLDS